ncbi:putative ribonuclease H-like domain-containing protein [Tanacetum coccineum]|uniref:Ribonuclease H-like domain-containing protein n=1 Tax=Tanacetum coccineum TaxID=301880 RepID=A0ABQ4WPK5_9ASTR
MIMRNKPDIDEVDIDDLYNNLRVYEDELKRSSGSNSVSQNLAFLSSENTNSTNEVSTASGDYGVSTAGGINQVLTTPSAHDIAYSFLAQPTTSPQLKNEDFQQMDGDDLEELDLRWQVAMFTVRVKKFIQRIGRNMDFKEKRHVSLDKSKIECYNCHRKGHFARECRSGRSQGRRPYGENGRSNAQTTESSSQALVAQDGLGGYDWSNDFEVEAVNYALMAISSSSSSSSSDSEVQKCSKCLESFKCLQKNYDTEREKHNKAKLEIRGYEIALESLEARILGHEKNELAWGERYEFQNYDLKAKDELPDMCTIIMASYMLKGNPEILLQDHAVVDSGGEVIPKGGKITGKGKIKTANLDFDDVYFVDELKAPRKDGVYSLDLKNIVPSGGLEKQLNHNVKIIRCDNGTKFKNYVMNDFCAKNGIKREFSIAKTPQQNGVAERKNRTLIEAARTMLADSLLSIPFWAEAFNTACYVLNRVILDAGTKDSYVAGSSGKDKGPTQEYILLALQPHRTKIPAKDVFWIRPFVSTDRSFVSTNRSNTPNVSVAKTSTGANADVSSFVYLGGKIPIDASTLPNADLPIDPNMPDLEDASDTLPNDGIFNGAYDDDEDVGTVADFNNIDNIIAVSPIPTLKIHKDHPKGQIRGDPTSTVQTRGKIQKTSSAQQALVSYIHKQHRTNHKDHQNCLFACFLSQEEPKTISQALKDESWVEAMQEELLQFKLQQVWILVDLPFGKKAIGTKWVFRNKSVGNKSSSRVNTAKIYIFEKEDIASRIDQGVGSTSGIRACALRNFDLEVMELENTQNNALAKLPMLKLGEYEISLSAHALPNEHQSLLRPYVDANSNVCCNLKLGFGGTKATKKEQKDCVETTAAYFEWDTHVVVWMNKPDFDTIGLDDLYNNFKIVEQRKFYLEGKIIIDVSNTAGLDNKRLDVSTAINWTFCRGMPSTRNGVGFDWSDMAEEEIQANMALMAFSDSEVNNDKSCSKNCLKNYKALKKQYDDLLVKLSDIGFKAATYKRGLTTLEDQIVKYRKHEVRFSEEIALLKRSVGSKEYELGLIRSELEKVKQEKEGVDFKIAKFDKSAKDLNEMLESLEEFKEPEINEYGPRDSSLKPTTGCDKESNNSKENTDDSLEQHQMTDSETSSFESPLKVDKDWKEKFFYPANHVSEVEPKKVRKNNDAPIIEDWVSDDEDEVESHVVKTDIPTAAKIEKPVRKPVRYAEMYRPVNTVRSVNTGRPFSTARQNVNTVRARGFNAVKPSACWVWKPIKPNGASLSNSQLNDKGFVDSGCSRHMSGNIAHLSDFKDFDGGYVTFGGGANGGRITGKGTIKTDKLDFDDVYFVKELKFNLFSVSQMCDKKNYVLFTDSECLVLSPNFKLPDENQILLKIPRQDNMYSFDMKNIVPKDGLTCLVAKATSEESMLWHRRLGHVNFKNINKLVKENLVRDLPLKRFENDQTCVACLKGKQHRASCKTKAFSPITKPLFMLHMDLFGPTFVSSLMHKKYCLVVTDDYSRFSWVFFLKTKDETSEILKNFIKEIENLVDKKVKIIRSDNGTEFKNKVLDEFCREKGIKREYSVARIPQQNGVVERKNRTLIEAARTMLADSKLPTTFWAEAVSTACYVQNRVLIVKPHNKTPYELFRGIKPAIGFMKPFGCHVTILNTLDKLGKFDGKSDEGFFVGYSLSSKAFRVYNIRTRKVQENLHVGFLENKPMLEGNGPKWLFDLDSLTQSKNYVQVVAGTFSNDFAGIQGVYEYSTSSQQDPDNQDYIVMPIWKDASYFDDASPRSVVDAHLQDQNGTHDDCSLQNNGITDQQVNTTSPEVNTGSRVVSTVVPEVNIATPEDLITATGKGISKPADKRWIAEDVKIIKDQDQDLSECLDTSSKSSRCLN